MDSGMPSAYVSMLAGQKNLASKLSYMSPSDITMKATNRTIQNIISGEQSSGLNFSELIEEEKKKEAFKIEKINDGRSSLETKDVGNIEYDEEKKPRTSVSDKHAEMKGVKRKERSGESSEDTEPKRKSKKKKKSSFKKGKKSKKRQSSSSSSSSNDSTNNSSSSGSSSSGKDRRKRQKEKKLKKSLKRLKKKVKQLKKRSTSSSPETSGVREVKRMLESQRKYQVEMIV